MSNLTNKKIESFFEKGVYVDGDGLRLRIDKNKNKSWSLRYQLAGKIREMGLGKYPIISLKDARKKTIQAKKIYIGLKTYILNSYFKLHFVWIPVSFKKKYSYVISDVT